MEEAQSRWYLIRRGRTPRRKGRMAHARQRPWADGPPRDSLGRWDKTVESGRIEQPGVVPESLHRLIQCLQQSALETVGLTGDISVPSSRADQVFGMARNMATNVR